MAIVKTNEFDTAEIELADVAKALAHPARVKILKILSEMNACMCGELVDLLPLAQATVSQHLKELKRVGLIKGNIEGPKICYCINKEVYEKLKKDFQEFFRVIDDSCSKCC